MTLNYIPFLCVMMFLALLIQRIKVNVCEGSPISSCIESERNALLDFKRGLQDNTSRLSSWIDEDCCSWEGIACDNKTGHVIRLDLRNPHPFSYAYYPPYNRWCLGGNLSTSLLGLKHLHYLDLSMNNFGGIPIPRFIGSSYRLRYLNFSNAGFGGLIPHQLGNLSRLQYLDLHDNFLNFDYGLFIDGALWISGLTSLRHLNMDSVNFQKVGNWMEALNMLPSIIEIHLSYCNLSAISLSLPHRNFTNLSVLDLSENNFSLPMIPLWLFNIRSLTYIDLSWNNIKGLIPAAVGNLTKLNVLDLSFNDLEGRLPKELGSLCKLQTLGLSGVNISGGLPELAEIFSGCIKYSIENLEILGSNITSELPEWLGDLQMLKTLDMSGNFLYGGVPESLGRLSALEELELGYNNLNGTLPESIGQLSKLVRLGFYKNRLEGVISEVHFANLTRLTYLDLSSNNKLVLKVSPDWIPPFQLKYNLMGSCLLGPRFPLWLQSQTNILSLDISNAGIHDTAPNWLWNLSSYLYVSLNGITGRLPDLSNSSFSEADLSSNYFEGPLPNLSSSVERLYLSNNSFSGRIHPNIIKSMPNLKYLLLSRNGFTGNIPSSLCMLQNLYVLDLSKNFLSGQIPDFWNQSNSLLIVLDFASNNLSGGIPHTLGSLTTLESLHLSNNSLSGEIPLTLQKCKSLITLDLGDNKFTGTIPTWLGESLSNLMILRLRSNIFVGKIPPNLSKLRALQILDIGGNNLRGAIPHSFGNFTAIKVTQSNRVILPNGTGNYEEYLQVKITGPNLEYYDQTLSQVTLMDLSNNELSGEIPGELGELYGLLSLNLSGNHLMGEIPENFSLLHSLESLDLSRNKLSGVIPSSMSSLTFLVDLNLSYNNLSGSIPSGNQFSTFINQSYIGNHGLCGFPLTQTCHANDTLQGPVGVNINEEEVGSDSDTWCFYVGMIPGFVVGFWVVLGTLLLKKNWKYAFFRYVDSVYDKVCVVLAVRFNGLRRNVV